MANPDHVKLIKDPFFSRWRMDNPDVRLDLSNAMLVHAQLGSADFDSCNLEGTVLHRANLDAASFVNANLRSADLSFASIVSGQFKGANLEGANFEGANLINSFMQNCNMRRACFDGANMKIVDFDDGWGNSSDVTEASFVGTIFSRPGESQGGFGGFLELATVKGLQTARFISPDWLESYLEAAFVYALRSTTIEAHTFAETVEKALGNIKALKLLLIEPEAPADDIVQVIDTVTTELIAYIQRHPEHLDVIKPRQFEELIAEVLASFGWDIELTKSTRDGGYDILGIAKDVASGARSAWVVECKKYSKERKVGIDVVRTLYGVDKVRLEGANMMLATTSYFTAGVHSHKTSRYNLELRDRDDVMEWIRTYKRAPGDVLYKP